MRLPLFTWLLLLANCLCTQLTDIRGISIYGLETENRGFVCDWVQPIENLVSTLAKLNFNFIRVPISYQYIKEGDLSKLDKIIRLAEINQMNVMIDMHRIWSWHQGPDPFENGVTLNEFTKAWIQILTRYNESKSVVGHNIYNEYQGPNATVVSNYSQTVIQSIEDRFPKRYVYFVTGTHWAGCLQNINLSFPEDITKRIYYSVHKYHFSGDGTTKDWDSSFGNLTWLNKTNIIIGEFGWDAKEQKQEQWAINFLTYLQNLNISNTFYWTVAHSFDTGNLFEDDCNTIKWKHYNLLKRFWDKSLPPRLRSNL